MCISLFQVSVHAYVFSRNRKTLGKSLAFRTYSFCNLYKSFEPQATFLWKNCGQVTGATETREIVIDRAFRDVLRS